MPYFYLLLIVAGANKGFGLLKLPYISDITILLLVVVLVKHLWKTSGWHILNNAFTWLIIFYLFMAGVQVSLASLHYGQSVMNGLVSIRNQLYYLSFFVFLLAFQDIRTIKAFLNALSVMALILFVLGLINYMGPAFLQSRWAEGHGIRGGVVRGFIPGMELVSLGLMWLSSAWVSGEGGKYSKLGAVLLMAAHFFRQTRIRIVSASIAIIAILVYRRQYKSLLVLVAVSIIGMGVAQLFLPEDFFENLYTSGVHEVVEGLHVGRAAQLQADWEVFKQHPLFGSGSLALRGTDGIDGWSLDHEELALIAQKRDLGYAHWAKSYGIVGLVWLFAFLFLAWKYSKSSMRYLKSNKDQVPLFVMSYTLFLVVSSLTLNQFQIPNRILLVCMLAAIAVRVRQIAVSGGNK